MKGNREIYEERADYSRDRLASLRGQLAPLPELASYPQLTVFDARLEASEYSDIDLFFLHDGNARAIEEPRTLSLRIFGRLIEIADKMAFPKFSNDCEYLSVLSTDAILEHLGGRTDDHTNYFTARMLLLLESNCLYGDATFASTKARIVESYFRDFPDHQQSFQPTFLLNDICRFWKTMLVNYENKRNLRVEDATEAKRTRQKVRNFKLKYSRMTTCFASVAALGSHLAPVKEEEILELTELTPRQRLESVGSRREELRSVVDEVLDRYAWFLEQTGLPAVQLEELFSDKQRRVEMFRSANEYGDAMYRLLQAIDAADDRLKLVRYLVI
jgi:hypothetical protein